MNQYRSPRRLHERTDFYKYTSTNAVTNILANGRLRWSAPSVFNDLFDIPTQLEMGWTAEDLEGRLLDRLLAAIESPSEYASTTNPSVQALLKVTAGFHLDDRRRLNDEVRNALKGATAPIIREAVADLQQEWRDIVETMRILCLSETNSDTVMWAHYAQNHSGVVLGLKCLDETDSALLMAHPVEYRESLPVLSTPDSMVDRMFFGKGGIHAEDIFEKYCYVKTPNWAYEREWRIVSYRREGESGNTSDYRFNPNELDAIFMGHKIAPDDEKAIRKLLVDRFAHVKLFRATLSMSERSIKFERT